MSGVGVVTHTSANAANFISRNGDADTTAPDQQSALAAATRYLLCHSRSVVGIIVGLRSIMGAEVDHLVSELAQRCNGEFVERNTSVVGSHGNTHLTTFRQANVLRWRPAR